MIKALVPCTVLLFVHGLTAQGEPSPAAMSYEKTDGDRVTGEVLGVEGSKVKLKVGINGGSMSRTYDLGDFTPSSVYAIRAAVTPPDDAAANLELARYAVQTNQVAAAKRSLAAARRIAGDPNLGKDVEEELAVAPARDLEARFREQLAKGQTGAAERTLRILETKHAGVVSADKLQALEGELQARQAQREAETVAAKAAKENERQVASRERALSPLHQRLDQAQKFRSRGMLNSKNFASANADFERAVALCDQVMRQTESLAKTHSNDDVMQRELAVVSEDAGQLRVDCLLTGASLYTTRGQFTAAMGNVNKVLAVDPRNQQAQAMRGRIEVAANSDGWGW